MKKMIVKLATAAALLLMPALAFAQTGSPVNIRDSSTGNQAQVTGGSLHVTSASGDATAAGTLNALNTTASIATAAYQGCGVFVAAGTLTGTITPEVSYDNGTTWVASQFFNPTTQALTATQAFTSPNAAASLTVLMGGGVRDCRVRVSVFTSGTAAATVITTQQPTAVATVEGSVSINGSVTVTGTVTANQGGAPWSENITQIGGASLALGQTTMAASIPVAIASNQSSLPVVPAGFSSGFITGQATVTGSAVALASNTVHSACVHSDAGNTVAFYVGPTGVTTGTGSVLYPGDRKCWAVANTNQLFLIDASGSPLAYFDGI